MINHLNEEQAQWSDWYFIRARLIRAQIYLPQVGQVKLDMRGYQD